MSGKAGAATVLEQDVEPIELTKDPQKEEKPSKFGVMHLFRMPAVVWQHLTDSERKSTQAVISGLNVSICTFGVRKLPDPGAQMSEPVPVSGMRAALPDQINFIQVGCYLDN